jgi:MFS transporter, DHA3 family, macrolide efflux protein
LSALQAGCGLCAALVAGRWADRWEHRRAMARADSVRALVLAALVSAWLVLGGVPPAGLALTILVLASAEAVFRPALAATLPGLLPDRALLPAANALFDTTERSARLLGPGLVGLLAGMLPVVHFFTLDALSFLLSAVAIVGLGRGGPPAPALRLPLRVEIARGFAAVRTHRLLWTVLMFTGPINGLWVSGFSLALPLLIERAHMTGPGGTGLGAYGLVISAYGATNLLATLVVGSQHLPPHPGRLMFTGSVIVGLGTAALVGGVVGGLPAAMLAAAFGAIGGPMKDVPTAVLRQTELPAADVAAATRAFMVAGYAGTLGAMLVAPSAARLLGPARLVLLCGVGLTLLALAGLRRHWADGRQLSRV